MLHQNQFWDILPKNSFWHNVYYPELLDGERFRTVDKKGKLFHIHGTLNNEMMTGVGEPEQLANTIFQRTDTITSLCVKPIMNENCRNEIERKVAKLIDSTDIFVIYGMSIGITDKKWWRSVVSRLLTEDNSYLLIVNYDKDYNPALPYTSSLVARKIISNLLEVSGCPQEYQGLLKKKIAVLPIILSIIYLPVAYFFALYAKYELLFLRMGFKEPDDKKLKINHRIKVIRLCKLSYKKVCRFLYEYLPKMYVRMSAAEFENIIDEFRGTTEHTYMAVIRHDRKYYISRNFTEDRAAVRLGFFQH